MQERHNALHYDSVLMIFQDPHHSNHHGFTVNIELIIASLWARTNIKSPDSLVLMTVQSIWPCLSPLRTGTATIVHPYSLLLPHFLSSDHPWEKSSRVNVVFVSHVFLPFICLFPVLFCQGFAEASNCSTGPSEGPEDIEDSAQHKRVLTLHSNSGWRSLTILVKASACDTWKLTFAGLEKSAEALSRSTFTAFLRFFISRQELPTTLSASPLTLPPPNPLKSLAAFLIFIHFSGLGQPWQHDKSRGWENL